MIERCEVDHLGCVLGVDGADVLDNGIRHVLKLHGIVPEFVKGAHIHLCRLRLVHPLHDVIGVVPALAAEIHGRKTAHWDIALCFSAEEVVIKPIICSPPVLDLKCALARIQSAHSFAIARCVISLRRRTSNSVP